MSASITDRITGFIAATGIPVSRGWVEDDSFLAGLTVRHGAVVYAPTRLAHPGDLLHEAGHIAVADPASRATLNTLSTDPGEEMAAIAWSYAALRAIEIDPAIVFHDEGYNGGAAAIIENFTAGRYFGVPLLQYYGMAARDDDDPERARYPAMQRWLR